MSKKHTRKVVEAVITDSTKSKNIVDSIKSALLARAAKRIQEKKQIMRESMMDAQVPDDSELPPETDVDEEPTEKQKHDLSSDHMKEQKLKKK